MRFPYLCQTIFITVTWIQGTCAWPGGVPATQCMSMSPSHNNVEPQQSPSPFSIHISRNTVQPGQPVRVTLVSNNRDVTFTGFFAMGRRINGNSSPVGSVILPEKTNSRYVKCNEVEGTAISHSWPTERNQFQFDWVAPLEIGDFVILASFVRNFRNFWVQQASETIRVVQ